MKVVLYDKSHINDYCAQYGKGKYNEGMKAYRRGKYARACNKLMDAIQLGDHFMGAITLADIMRRNLCDHNHTRIEAADYFVLAAEHGDGDALSCIDSYDFNYQSREELVEQIARIGVK